MTSKERLLACWNGKKADHIPLTTWCFGLRPKAELTWEKNGKPVQYWYSMRMEHIHELTEPWELDDDFKRVLAWQSLGIDDMLDVSVPWSMDPEVTCKDSVIVQGHSADCPVMVREYATPAGAINHIVKKTGENPGEGWPIQPDYVPIFEDFNIPRGIKHLVSKPEDIPAIKHLYMAPDKKATEWFNSRMKKIAAFSEEHGIAVQAWPCFGMDGIIWLMGIETAVMMAIDNPKAFGQLIHSVEETDFSRAELACKNPAVDMIVQRGWYSSTDFWSPKIFDEFIYPQIAANAALARRYGKKFGYVMTTGVGILGKRLIDAGVDVLYFMDPVLDATITVEKAREIMGNNMTLAGGVNTVTLTEKNGEKIKNDIKKSIDILGPTNRFILHPVDALFPDTPWESVELMIETWDKYK